MIENIGRGSWIRTNDLQYPKLAVTVEKTETSGKEDSHFTANHSDST
jgi:hypothetical protein